MTIYSYKKVNTGSPFGTVLNPVKFSYKIIGELGDRTYIETDEENIPVQDKRIDFKLEVTNPIEEERAYNLDIKNTEKRINEIKEELITAVLLDDTNTITALKAEYQALIGVENE